MIAQFPFEIICGPEKGRFVDAVLWQLMLEVSTVSFHTGSESNTPLLDCCIDDILTEQAPLFHETHLQMFNVTYLATIYTLLENAPNFVIDRIEVGTVWRPQQRRDEVWRLSWQQLHILSCPMCWSAVLLKSEIITWQVLDRPTIVTSRLASSHECTTVTCVSLRSAMQYSIYSQLGNLLFYPSHSNRHISLSGQPNRLKFGRPIFTHT